MEETKSLITDILNELKSFNANNKRIMTVDEVAKFLGVSRSVVYRWTAQRLIPHSKVNSGRIIFFDRRKVIRWALQNEVRERDLLLEKALIPLKAIK